MILRRDFRGLGKVSAMLADSRYQECRLPYEVAMFSSRCGTCGQNWERRGQEGSKDETKDWRLEQMRVCSSAKKTPF